MIITFFGHSNYREMPGHRQRILEYIESISKDSQIDFYLGGYGNFDSFALSCAKSFQQSHPNTKIYFVTPYITESYEKSRLKNCSLLYDGIIYPPLEDAPLKYAISHRNKWMAERADVIIAFVKRNYGGAFTSLRHTKMLGKVYLNIAE